MHGTYVQMRAGYIGIFKALVFTCMTPSLEGSRSVNALLPEAALNRRLQTFTCSYSSYRSC